MRNKIAAALVIIGIAIAFDACAQAEYAMIWRDTFLMQSGFGMLLGVMGLFVAGGVFAKHNEDEAEPKEKRRP